MEISAVLFFALMITGTLTVGYLIGRNHSLKQVQAQTTNEQETDMEVSNFTAGIVVVLQDGTLKELPGTCLPPGTKLAGGWAKVKNCSRIARVSVSYKEAKEAGYDRVTPALLRSLALKRAVEELNITTAGTLLSYSDRQASLYS